MIKYLKGEVKKYRKSDFARNVLTMFSGISISQIIPIIISPFLTRLYPPSDFALLGLFTTTALFFGNIATLQYDKAIILPNSETDAKNVFAIALLSVLGMTFLSMMIMIFFNGFLISLMDNPGMRFWLYIVPFSVFIQGVFRTLNMWAVRLKKFKVVALRNVTQGAFGAGTKLALGFLKYVNGGLIIGSLAGQTVATGIIGLQISEDIKNIRKLSYTDIKNNAFLYRKFPLYTNWQHMTNMINSTGTNYAISNIFGSSILGLFSFTFGLLNRPLQLIGQSISQVFYQKVSETYKKGQNILPLVKKIFFRLFFVGLIIFIPILLLGPRIFNFIFGEEWKEAGIYAQIMAPWLFAKFITSPIAYLHIILGKQKQFFIFGLFLNTIIPIVFIISGGITKNFHYTLILASGIMISYSIFIIFYFLNILKYTKVNCPY